MQLYRNSIMKNHSCLHAVFVLALAMLFFACTSPFGGWGALKPGGVFSQADSLMNHRPDSALQLLETLLPDTNSMRKGDLMRFHLLRTNAQNKCDTVLTARHAALMRRVCDYYDRKSPSPFGEGSGVRLSNSRMLAHYLLGRCYSDMGEAPAALQEFHNAADAADTTSTDCDNFTLSRVHVQTGYLFVRQFMPKEAIVEYRKAHKIACSIHDTIAAISSYESMASPYNMLNMKDSVINISLIASQLYKQLGMSTQSSRALSSCIYHFIQDRQYTEAKKYIDIYEKEGDLFDSNNHLKRSTALIYAFKGEYFLSKEVYDSAKHYFYKDIMESSCINNRICSYSGLARLYHLKHENDSAYKYAQLCTQYTDSSYVGISALHISQKHAMYNYERNLREAEQETHKRQVAQRLNYFLCSLIILSVIFTVAIFSQRHKSNKMKQRIIYSQYALLLTKLCNVESDMELMKNKRETLNQQIAALQTERNDNQMIIDKLKEEHKKGEDRISDLETKKKQLEEEILQLKNHQNTATDILSEKIIHSSTIVYLHKLARKGEKATQAEWDNIIYLINKCIPNFIPSIRTLCPSLDNRKLIICLLTKLRFKQSEIICLLDITSQILTNDRRQMNEKMFGCTDSVKSFDERIRNLN